MITLEEFKKKHSDKCRLIGLDLGSKRIGVSICDEKQLIATPLKTINRNTLNELISELKVIINENNIGNNRFTSMATNSCTQITAIIIHNYTIPNNRRCIAM